MVVKKYQNPVRMRLHEFVTKQGLNENQFVEACGLSRGWWIGKGTPTGDSLCRVKNKYPKLSLEWLFSGIGPMTLGEVIRRKVENEEQDPTPVTGAGKSLVEAAVAHYAAEPEATYGSPSDDLITIPRSVLDDLRAQLTIKDTQITMLMDILNTNRLK